MAAQRNLSPQQFGAYTITAEPGLITATHPDTAAYGSIGHLSYDQGRVGDVFVDRAHRHQGLATAMYHTATRANGRPLAHSSNRTDAGDAWARSVGGTIPPRTDVNGR